MSLWRAFFELELYFCRTCAKANYNRMKKAAIFAALNYTEIILNYTFRFNHPSPRILYNYLVLFILTFFFPIPYFVLFVFPPLLPPPVPDRE